MNIDTFASGAGGVIDEVERALIGKRSVVRLVLAAFLANGHVLIDDLPGLGKTLLVRSLATATGLDHSRIQFTPDLMPMDITGSMVLDPASRTPVFRPGPVFTNLLLADEINRAPAKTQAALLEAMQERQVTTDGTTRQLGSPFLVVATQNPIEYEGTYPLPEAQLDRFLVRVEVGYPDSDSEWEILSARAERQQDEVELGQVLDGTALIGMQRFAETVHVSEPVGRYMVDLVSGVRGHRRVRVGPSPRGTLALMKLSRVVAALEGRDFVLPDDVQAITVPALAHRLVLRPEAWAQGIDERAVVTECLGDIAVPTTDFEPR